MRLRKVWEAWTFALASGWERKENIKGRDELFFAAISASVN